MFPITFIARQTKSLEKVQDFFFREGMLSIKSPSLPDIYIYNYYRFVLGRVSGHPQNILIKCLKHCESLGGLV